MLVWHRQLWLIDHGATLYFHHGPGWEAADGRARDAFPLIRDHVLLPHATVLDEVDPLLTSALAGDTLAGIVAGIPDAWIGDRGVPIEEVRGAYLRHLTSRLQAPRRFVEEAIGAR
jgi:hypothetical protein